MTPASGQLRGELNLPRAGDELLKEQVAYFEPGEAGKDLTWDFSGIRLTDEAYIVHYFTRADWKIIGAENGKLSFLEIAGDSLLLGGYETPSHIVKFRLPGLLLRFPITYGSISHGEFFGRGKHHDRLESIVSGEIRSEADASGRLILPGGETLTGVIRVHVRKIERSRYAPVTSEFSVDHPDEKGLSFSAETETIACDTYQWYEEGYRYPVMETVETIRIDSTGETVLSRKAYFYHPAEQDYLPEDPANRAVLERKHAARHAKMLEKESNIVSFACYPNPASDHLDVELTLRKETTVNVTLLDMSGRTVRHFHSKNHLTHHRETITVRTLPPGYYILKVSAGDESVSEKILKN